MLVALINKSEYSFFERMREEKVFNSLINAATRHSTNAGFETFNQINQERFELRSNPFLIDLISDNEKAKEAGLYCLTVYQVDLPKNEWEIQDHHGYDGNDYVYEEIAYIGDKIKVVNRIGSSEYLEYCTAETSSSDTQPNTPAPQYKCGVHDDYVDEPF